MNLKKWIERVKSQYSRSRPRPVERRPRLRLGIEQLEERVVLSADGFVTLPTPPAGLAAVVAQSPVAPLATPALVGPSGFASATNLTLAWKPVANATAGYRYNLTDVTSGQAVPVEKGTAPGTDGQLGTAKVAAALTVGHVYQWKVRALSTDGNRSAWSAPATFTAARVKGVSAVAVVPSSILNLSVAGVAFDPATKATLLVRYPTGATAQIINVGLKQSGVKTSFSVAVPTFFDFTTGQPAAGTVELRLKQSTATGVKSVDLGAVQIADLPDTGLAPGTMADEFLTQMQAFQGTQIQNLQSIAAASPGRVNVSAMTSQLQASQGHLAALQTQLQQLIAGTVTKIPLGQASGVDVFLDQSSLAVLDRQIASWFADGGIAAPPALALSRAALNSGALTAAGSDPFGSLTSSFANYISKDFISQANDAVGRLRTGLTVAVGGAALVAAAVGAVPVGTALGAAAVAGAVIWGVTTLTQMAISTSIQGGVNSTINGKATYQDFRETATFARDSALDAIISYGTSKFGEGLPTQPAGAVLAQLADMARGTYDFFTKGTSSTQAVVDQIAAAFKQLHAELTQPTISAAPGSMNFTQTFGGPPDADQTLTVQNTGHGTLNYSISAPSWINVSSFGGSLDEGAADSLVVSPDASTPPGDYDGVITISDPEALNPLVSVSVHLTVERPAAQISVTPSSATFDVTVDSPSGDAALLVSNTGPVGSLLHWSYVSPSNRASLSGTPDVPGGSDEFLVLHYDATGLAAGNYTDSITLFSLDDPSVPDVTVSISVHVTGGQTVYSGSFSGFVQDNTAADGTDPDGDAGFRDNNYGGPATLTVTQNANGTYHVVFEVNINQSVANNRSETFNVGHQTLQGDLSSVNFSFTFAMNDHCNMVGQASLSGNAVQGTWQMQVTNSSDSSDSGSGSFILFLQ